jgi:hypothetical protein
MTHRNKVLSSLTLALPHKISAFEQALRLVKNVKKLVKFLTSTCKKDEHTDKHWQNIWQFQNAFIFRPAFLAIVVGVSSPWVINYCVGSGTIELT